MTEVLRLKKSNCKNCYKCIRHCPVKSIKISGNQAHIIGNECILCGQCFVVCPQNAKEIVAEKIANINMPYVTERWPGGMLTNFPTIRKAVKKMTTIDKMEKDGTFDHLSKREKLQIARQRAKLEKNLGSIADLSRLPAALFVVDVMKEHIAVKEARTLGIPVFGMVDTNSDPNVVDFVIPCNDDASTSISLIIDKVADAIKEGLTERKAEREKEGDKKGNEKADKEAQNVEEVAVEETSAE